MPTRTLCEIFYHSVETYRKPDHLKVKREYTAVAVNREITPKAQYADTRLKDGDKVEVVRPMGGG